MTRKNKTSQSKKVTMILLALAAVLLVGSAIGNTRAALSYFSNDYVASLSVSEIDVALVENGTEAPENLLGDLLGDNEKLVLGKAYDEELAVRNTGDIDQYVRVRIVKSWTKDGEKVTTLSPDNIILGLNNTDWIEDTNASTPERTVLYYSRSLASGDTTPNFMDTITIDQKVAVKASEETIVSKDGYTTIKTTYKYDGVLFSLEAQVDAVQVNNAEDAIKSAWGVDVEEHIANDGTRTISLQ